MRAEPLRCVSETVRFPLPIDTSGDGFGDARAAQRLRDGEWPDAEDNGPSDPNRPADGESRW